VSRSYRNRKVVDDDTYEPRKLEEDWLPCYTNIVKTRVLDVIFNSIGITLTKISLCLRPFTSYQIPNATTMLYVILKKADTHIFILIRKVSTSWLSWCKAACRGFLVAYECVPTAFRLGIDGALTALSFKQGDSVAFYWKWNYSLFYAIFIR